MTAKEFLNKGRRMNFEIDELVREQNKAFAKACATAVNYDGEHVQTSPGNVTENKFISYTDYSATIDRKIDELYEYRIKMHELISTIDNTVYRAILIARYINCDTWESIADRFKFKDVRHIYRLHGKALRQIPYKEFMSIVSK